MGPVFVILLYELQKSLGTTLSPLLLLHMQPRVIIPFGTVIVREGKATAEIYSMAST